MLQVWDAMTMFAFNGVSWFLCDLLICCAFTPFMSYVVQRARGKGDGGRGFGYCPYLPMRSRC